MKNNKQGKTKELTKKTRVTGVDLPYQHPELLELGELSQLIRGNTGSFNDGNSPNPRPTP